MKLKIAFATGASLLAIAGVAHAQEDPRDAIIRQLTARLDALESQVTDLKESTAADAADVRNIIATAPVTLPATGRPTIATGDGQTKFAIRGLTEALELEWRRYGIRVIAMWPLFVATAMVDGLDTRSTKALGVHLTAEDVAEEIYAATHPTRTLLPRVHYPVGRQTKFLAVLAQVSPNWMSRLLNKTVTRT